MVKHIALLCEEAIQSRGKFVVALSGGSLPKYLDELINVCMLFYHSFIQSYVSIMLFSAFCDIFSHINKYR